MPRELADPEPKALIWARKAAGLELEEAAGKAKVKAEQLLLWESGKNKPTFPQLTKLANVYKRPTALFYLENLPELPSAPADFRRTDAKKKVLPRSFELTLEMRKARDRRDWLIDLLKELGESIPKFDLHLDPKHDAESAAGQIRDQLGVSIEEQVTWTTEYEAFGRWREKAEKSGILCFQARNVALKECRGFSISEGEVPVAVTNIKEAPRGRIFTLLHEIAHICLNQVGICDLTDGTDIETHCNRIAGAAIYPREPFLESEVVRKHGLDSPTWDNVELSTLSRRFGGSREAALVRLLSFGLTTQTFYERKREELRKEYENREKKGGFVPHHTIELSCAGGLFTRTVLESLERNNITLADAAAYLHIGYKHIDEADRVATRFTEGANVAELV